MRSTGKPEDERDIERAPRVLYTDMRLTCPVQKDRIRAFRVLSDPPRWAEMRGLVGEDVSWVNLVSPPEN